MKQISSDCTRKETGLAHGIRTWSFLYTRKDLQYSPGNDSGVRKYKQWRKRHQSSDWASNRNVQWLTQGQWSRFSCITLLTHFNTYIKQHKYRDYFNLFILPLHILACYWQSSSRFYSLIKEKMTQGWVLSFTNVKYSYVKVYFSEIRIIQRQ
jgi:hypothetical protein